MLLTLRLGIGPQFQPSPQVVFRLADIAPPDLTGQVHCMDVHKFAFGENADVWKGQWIDKNSGCVTKVAVKVLRTMQPGQPNDLLEEIRGWSTVRHPNVTPFLGISWDFHRPGTPCLVRPYYPHGNIASYIKMHPKVDKLALLAQTVSGLSYLHSLELLHGNLKGSKILINDNREVSVVDFGLSRVLRMSGFTTSTTTGTTRYMAPELFHVDEEGESISQVTRATDIWAFAMTVIELFTQSVPFPHIKSDTRVSLFVISGGRPDRHLCLQINDDIWTMLQNCWNVEPNRRPSMADLVEFFSLQVNSGVAPCARL